MKYVVCTLLLFSQISFAADKVVRASAKDDGKTYKILIDLPRNKQDVVEVLSSGGVNSPAVVLWDERVDGPMPPIVLGAMERSGSTLLVNNEKKAAYDQVLANEEAAKLAKQNAIDAKKARMSVLLDKMSEGKATPEETQEFLTLIYK